MPRRPGTSTLRRLDEQRKALAEHPASIGLAKRIAANFPPMNGLTRDDYTSAAFLGLCQAAASFDFRPGMKFSTFAARRIAGAIIDAVRAQVPLGYTRKAQLAPIIISADAMPVASGDDQADWAAEYQDEVIRLVRRAPDRHTANWLSCYAHADEATHREMSRRVGISQQWLSELKKRFAKIIDEDLERRRKVG